MAAISEAIKKTNLIKLANRNTKKKKGITKKKGS